MIVEITCQTEKDMNCKYSDNIKIFPSNLTKENKVNDLMHAEDPVIVLKADVEKTKIGYRSFNKRLHDLEEKLHDMEENFQDYNDKISKQNDTISEQNGTISKLRSDLEINLLYPLIIRELINKSR